jgi:hypothetical protein
MLTPILPTPLPGIAAADLTALGFSFIPDFGGFYLCPFGDYQFSLESQLVGPAVACLVLDEELIFAVEVPDKAALVAAHTRAGNEVATRQAKRYTSKILLDTLVADESIADRACTAALENMGMADLFTESPEGTTPW